MPFRNVAVSLNERHLVDFPQGGQTQFDFIKAAFAQGDHSFFASSALDFRSRTAVNNHFANTVRKVEKFADGGAAMVASAGAFEASGAFGQGNIGPLLRLKAGFAHFVGSQLFYLLAVCANHANETLCQDAVERRNKVVGFDAHVDKAADDVGDVVGVNGRENEVSRKCGLNRDLRGFLVANFAHHDLVRVMTQDGAQASGKR